MMRARFALTLVALALPMALLAQGADPRRRFSDTTAVVAVEVPVQVVADGQPVRGLTAADFEISEGRAKHAITGFEVIDLSQETAAPQPRAAPPTVSSGGRRHFLMLFDLSFSEPSAILRARQAAAQLVEEGLHPTDLVGVATYSSSRGPQLVLGFTADRRQVALALDTLGAPELVDRSPDPLGLMVAELESDMQRSGTGSGAGAEGRAARDQMLLESLQDFARQSERATREHQAGRVTALTRSFADLARLMSVVKGRKYVVYLSEGFDSRLLVGDEQQTDLETTGAIESGEVWKVDSEARYGNTRVQNDLQQMLDEFRRADCVIQSVDIGGLRAAGAEGQRASGVSALVAMAKDTGGDFYQNYNDLHTAMGDMLRRTSVTYLLVFQPQDLKPDGKFRRLDVKVKNAPRGARVVHRPGYYAPKPFAERSTAERQMITADAIVGGQDGGALDTSVLAAPFRVGQEKAYVPVLIEVSGESLLRDHKGGTMPVEIYVYAIDAQGGVSDYLVHNLGLDLAKVGPAMRQSGLKFFGHLDLRPGDYAVRAMVRNAQTGASGLRVAAVSVPPLAGGQPTLLPPLFPEEVGKWLLAREPQKPDEPQVPYPFMLGEQPYIPAARPVLRPGDETQVCIVGFDLGEGEMRVRAIVETPDGQPLEGGQLSGLQVSASEGHGAARLVGTFKPAGLAAGHYALRLAVESAGGRAESVPVFFEVAAGS